MKYIFWDIDGTLLLTGKAGYDALLQAIKERFNIDNYQFTHSLAGATDAYIVKEIVKNIKGQCSAADVASLLVIYHRTLAQNLSSHTGSLMYNVKNTLEYFSNQSTDYQTCLLTGNTRIGSYLKLEHYAISSYFQNQFCICGELSENRCDLARIAYQRLYLHNPNIKPEDITIIGDTPNDIICAQEIGARSLIILTGSTYKKHDLEKYSPWRIIERLPDNPQELINLLNES